MVRRASDKLAKLSAQSAQLQRQVEAEQAQLDTHAEQLAGVQGIEGREHKQIDCQNLYRDSEARLAVWMRGKAECEAQLGSTRAVLEKYQAFL